MRKYESINNEIIILNDIPVFPCILPVFIRMLTHAMGFCENTVIDNSRFELCVGKTIWETNSLLKNVFLALTSYSSIASEFLYMVFWYVTFKYITDDLLLTITGPLITHREKHIA